MKDGHIVEKNSATGFNLPKVFDDDFDAVAMLKANAAAAMAVRQT